MALQRATYRGAGTLPGYPRATELTAVRFEPADPPHQRCEGLARTGSATVSAQSPDRTDTKAPGPSG